MTRKETLQMLLSQARTNGFDFRRWFQANISNDWPGAEDAVSLLTAGGRYYALLFSHDFARSFWQKGAQMNFVVPAATYSRMNGKGQVVTITRKPFTRRTIKADVWRYHLRQMSVAEDPIRYLKRFLPTHEDMNSHVCEVDGLPAVS
jgi:hypothetical protein